MMKEKPVPMSSGEMGETAGLATSGPVCRLLPIAQHPVLAAALGDSPETVQSVHVLRRGLCRAYIAGDLPRFGGAIVQSNDWPEEPAGFGSDPDVLWALLEMVEGWTCILVDAGCAPGLAERVQAAQGGQVRFLDERTHVLAEPASVIQDPLVRRLTLNDLSLLESAPLELRTGLWSSTRQLLAEGTIACAVVSGQIVATALVTAYSDRYADIGVYTRKGYRGRGFATAATSLVAQTVQEGGRMPVWGAGAHNAASLRVAQKVGFREVSRRTYVILDHGR
jgi:GNAT superfamily N-acetyltransferase